MLKKTAFRRWLLALLAAFFVLLFCSKSSPLYPINDWADANIYFTIGKGMTRGSVVYRDLYDHKGPLLYALHALCALVSFDTFTGVFVLEVLLAAWWIGQMQRLFEAQGLGRWSYAAALLTAVLVYTSKSFSEGDSAEELALPFIACTLCGALGHWTGGKKPMRTRTLVWQGFVLGCVFFLKFTLVGIQAGVMLCLFIRQCRNGWRSALGAVDGWLAGFALSALPWLVYFGLNGAIGDFVKVYLYDNLFLYGGEGAGLKGMAKSGISWLVNNLRYALPLLTGVALSLRLGAWQALCVWLAAGLGAAAAFAGGKEYVYYGLVLAPLLAVLPLCLGAALHKLPRWTAAAACALAIALCPFLTQNPNPSNGVHMLQAKETTMQMQIASHIPKGASLLNYNFMDAGFYTAGGLVPHVKYFHLTNVPLPEMKEEQHRYIEEGVVDYVVARLPAPAFLEERYTLVTSAKSPNFWYDEVGLFRLSEPKNR